MTDCPIGFTLALRLYSGVNAEGRNELAYARDDIEAKWLGPEWDRRSAVRFIVTYGEQVAHRDVPPTGHVTVPEMAALLGVSRVAALGYVRNRLVPVALTLGRKNLIRLADVVEFRKRRQGGEFTNRRLFPFGDE